MKKIVALAILTSAIAAPALAETQSFTRDGQTYTYEVKQAGEVAIVNGTDQSGKAFSLRVRNGRVSGNYAGTAVAFAAPKVQTAAANSSESPLATR
ncbi:hypothetical protein [Sphingomonas crocodyli]|uniref:Uncharacterized protein n=1 Tax=Sphingomonas crocodyli TaxID=1979270 RepID=A0A437M812_9SPHN|nr:hypothetical protein [Sphingomonas crocodyli]RVT93842.1 hypothetical protein EOD43_08260 [Sphingomonas crocodyli]